MRIHRLPLDLAGLAVLALTACGGDDAQSPPLDAAAVDAAALDARVDAALDAAIDAPAFVEPTLLSQTGLYAKIATKTVAAGVVVSSSAEPGSKLKRGATAAGVGRS